ncbi:VOC family protein [Pseudonocardia ailaonensis]
MTDISIAQAYLPHTGKDEAIAFYRDVLGFEVRSEVGYNDLYWITVGPVGQPNVSIVLTPPAVDPGITDDERRVISEMMAKGTFGAINLTSQDVDETFATLQAGDAEVVQEPTDQPYGVRDCAFRDPAGNTIRIAQAK